MLKRVQSPDVETVDFLLNASYYDDDAHLPTLLRLCVTDSAHFKIYKYMIDNKTVGACLVRIEDSIFYIWLCSGKEFFDWAYDGSRELGEEAKLLGCKKMKFYGRLGWLRRYPENWKPNAVELVMELK